MKHITRALIFFGIFGALLALGFVIQAYCADSQISHGLAMHGDLKYKSDFKHFEYANPNAPKGGMIRLNAIGTFDSLNPFILKGNPAAGIGFIFETLTVNANDEPFSVYGLLAETIEMPQDRSWVIFNLRKEARWHDGTSVTSEDVIFSFEALTTKGHPFYRMYYHDVIDVVAQGKLKVKFIFEKGSNPELPLIMGQLTIVQKAYYSEHDFAKTSLDVPMGSGPYKIKDVKPGRSITYERDPNYWGRDIAVNKGRYNFDTMRYEYYRDATIALEAFKAGEYDFRFENTAKVWATAYKGPAFDNRKIIKEELPDANPTGMQAFVFNMRRKIFQDKRTRQALTYLFDFEWTNENLFYSAYTRTESYFSNSELASTGLPGPDELQLLNPYRDKLPKEVFTKAYKAPSTAGNNSLRENIRIAHRLLREAGWYLDEGKLYYHDRQTNTTIPLKFEILLINPGFERIVVPFKQNLERLGIEVDIRLVDSSQYINIVQEFDFDMIVTVWGQSLSPGNEQRNMWSSDAADTSGTRNYAGINNEVVDALIEEVIKARDRQELITACKALDRVLLWGHYCVPHWHIRAYRIAYWNMFDRPTVKPKYALGFVDTWWIDQDKLEELKR